jgi:hypothetical protein
MVEQRSQLAMRLRPANAAVWSIDVPNSLVTRKSGCAQGLFSQVLSTRLVLSSPAAKNITVSLLQKL